MPRTISGWTVALSLIIVAVALLADPATPVPDLLARRFGGIHLLIILTALSVAAGVSYRRHASKATRRQRH